MNARDQESAHAAQVAHVLATPSGLGAVDEVEGPLDDNATSDAVAALPEEARGACLSESTLDALDLGRAVTTGRTYHHRLRQFVRWCATRGLRAFPAHPEMLCIYFRALAHDHRWSTLHVARAAIAAAHAALGYEPPDSPRLHETLQHLRCTLARLHSASLVPIALLDVVARCSGDPLATRDRALILALHFGRLLPQRASMANRDQLVRRESSYLMKLAPLRATEDSTPDPVELWCQPNAALCPVRALDAWLAERASCLRGSAGEAARGALFVTLHGGRGYPLVVGCRLGPRGISRILKRRATSAGLDPNEVSAFKFRARTPSARSHA